MSEVKRISVFIHGPNKSIDMVEAAHLDRVTAERDAALADVDRLDKALNVTDAAAKKWLADLTGARELFELILDDPRLVVAMSSDILVPIKSLLSSKSEPFESKVYALQQRLNAQSERVGLLEGLLFEYRNYRQATLQEVSDLRDRVDAALKPAEGGGDIVDYHDLCASKGCDAGKSGGSLFCATHQSAKSRTRAQSPLTAEGLEWMMQNDGYQQ